MSSLSEALIVNGIVLVTVLASDLGPARKIGTARLLRPVIAAAVIIPVFISSPVLHGSGLAVELAGIAAGVLGGLALRASRRIAGRRNGGISSLARVSRLDCLTVLSPAPRNGPWNAPKTAAFPGARP